MERLAKWTIGLWLLIMHWGCYEPKEACLDLLAVNYDASADDACADCCTYPSFKLGIQHLWNDRKFILQDTFTNNLGDSFIVISQKFYLGGIEIGNDAGAPVPFINKTTYKWLDGSSKEWSTNFKLVSGTLTEISVNSFREEGNLTYLTFGPGPDEGLNGVDTLSLSRDSDLATATGMRTKDNKYLCYKAKIIAGIGLKDTLDVGFEGQWRIQKMLNPKLALTWGQEAKISINIRYDRWFDNVPLKDKNAELIATTMKSNLEAAFQQ